MENKSISALMGINGCKPVVVVSLAFVGVYTVKKLVDKFFSSSVVINAEGTTTGGK